MRLTLPLAVLLTLACAPAARAGTVSLVPAGDGTRDMLVRFVADPGERNDVRVAPATGLGTAGQVVVIDEGAPLATGDGCRIAGPGAVCSPLTGTIAGGAFDLGDEDDHFVGGLDHVVVDGGTGADTFDATGPARVTVSYATRTAPVRVTLDDAADDGEIDEGDRVGRTIQGVTGGRGDDLIDASGWHAADGSGRPASSGVALDGGPGDDQLAGAGTADTISGGPGDDVIAGGTGADTLDGGPGHDTVSGGAGRDHLRAASTDDLSLRDGESDQVSCSSVLTGTVTVDARDRFMGCAPPTRVVRTRLHATRTGAVAVPLACGSGSLPCSGVITLLTRRRAGGHGGTRMGRASFRVEPDTHGSARVAIKGGSRRALLGGKKVVADVRDTVGAIETAARRPLTLLPAR